MFSGYLGVNYKQKRRTVFGHSSLCIGLRQRRFFPTAIRNMGVPASFIASWSMGQLTQSDAILSWLRQREDEMAALLAEVVSVPTENPPGKNYRACVDLLESRLRKASLSCERFVSGV